MRREFKHSETPRTMKDKQKRIDLIKKAGITTEWESWALSMVTDTCTPKEAFVGFLKRRDYQSGWNRESINEWFNKTVRSSETAKKSKRITESERLAGLLEDILDSAGRNRLNWELNAGHNWLLMESLRKYTFRHSRKVWFDEIIQVAGAIPWEKSTPSISISKDSLTHGHYDEEKNHIVIPRNIAIYSCLLDAKYALFPNHLREGDDKYIRSMFPLTFPDTNKLESALYKIKVLNADYTIGDAYFAYTNVMGIYSHYSWMVRDPEYLFNKIDRRYRIIEV